VIASTFGIRGPVHMKDKDGAILPHVRDAGIIDFRAEHLIATRDKDSVQRAVLQMQSAQQRILDHFDHITVRITTEPSRPRWATIRINFAALVQPINRHASSKSSISTTDEQMVRVSDIVKSCKTQSVQQRVDRWTPTAISCDDDALQVWCLTTNTRALSLCARHILTPLNAIVVQAVQ
jgi:hypothetical protein